LLETVRGFAELRALAAVPGLSRIAFGGVDFSLESASCSTTTTKRCARGRR